MRNIAPARYLGLFALMAVVTAVAGIGIISTTGPVHAESETVDSGASVVTQGAAPVIECKWELPDVNSDLEDGGTIQYGNDDSVLNPGFPCNREEGGTTVPTQADNVGPVIHVLPNAEDDPEERRIENWVAVDHPNGVDEIDDVFWKVFHPDGTLKFQIHGNRVDVADLGDLGTPGQQGTMFDAAWDTGQVSAGAITDVDFGIIDLVIQRQKDLYYQQWSISKDQMCGEYEIEVTAVAGGATATLTNTLVIQCFFNLEIDFEDVNWGTITPGGTKVLNGDTNFGTSDFPTVKNTGNSGMRVGIEFSELVQDEVLGPKIIDQFDAAFGKSAGVLEWIDPIAADDQVWFNNWSINQVLCANEVGKLDLSVHPPEVVPAGSYSGDVTVYAMHAPGVCPNDLLMGDDPAVEPTVTVEPA